MKKQQHGKTGMGIMNAMVLIVIAFLFLCLYLFRFSKFPGQVSLFQNILIYSIIYLFITYRFELYRIGNIRLLDMLFGMFFLTVGTNILFFLQLWVATGFKENLRPLYLGGISILQFCFGAVAGYLTNRLYLKTVPRKQLVAVVGERPEDTLLWNRMNLNPNYEIIRIMQVKESVESILEAGKSCDGLLLGDIPVHERNDILRKSFHEGIQIFYMLKIADILVQNATRYKIYDQIFLMDKNSGLNMGQQIRKRIFDVVVSAILLILLSPLSLIIALLIKQEDGGEIFYKQPRITKDGKEFMIYKFRSMREDAESDGPRLARKEDVRVTKVGSVIRNLHFDEIPQLWNVLKGDMSLVGPRPERQIFIEEYKKVLPEFESRLKVKAGITGYAQVYGKYNSNPYDKLKMDLLYITHYSIFLDIRLLIQTVRILFQKESAEGVEYDMISALPKDKEHEYEK